MNRRWRSLCLGLGVLLGSACPGAASFHETRLYDCLGPVRQFADIEVALAGSAESFGITTDELRDYARQVFDERLPGLRVETLDVDSLVGDRSRAEQTGLLQFVIWTVRESYPVIFHIEGRAGSAQCLFDGRAFYKISHLGYVPDVEVRNTAKASIREMIDRIAAKFFDGRPPP